MAETVVYVSKTGFTERYARMLAERLGTRALPLDEAVKSLGKGGDVVIAAVAAATRRREELLRRTRRRREKAAFLIFY